MNNCQINWEAVSAISSSIQAMILFVSALAIISQLRQYRRESIENRITGLDTAIKLLNNSEDFTKASNAIMRSGKVLGVLTWSNIFEVVDQIVLLIEEKYTDPNLLFKLKGHELAAVGRYLSTAQLPEETKQELASAKYKGVRDLFERAIKYVDDTK